MLKLPPAIPPAAPWPRTRVVAALGGVVAGLVVAAAILVAAGFADGGWHSYIASTFGWAGLWSGYSTYKATVEWTGRRRHPRASSEETT